jgi:hypothetical protein
MTVRPARPAADRAQAAACQADRQGQAASHPVEWSSDGRRPDRVRARLPHGAGGHRLEAHGCALPQRAFKDVGQDEEPGERGGAPGARGRVALAPSGLHPAANVRLCSSLNSGNSSRTCRPRRQSQHANAASGKFSGEAVQCSDGSRGLGGSYSGLYRTSVLDRRS